MPNSEQGGWFILFEELMYWLQNQSLLANSGRNPSLALRHATRQADAACLWTRNVASSHINRDGFLKYCAALLSPKLWARSAFHHWPRWPEVEAEHSRFPIPSTGFLVSFTALTALAKFDPFRSILARHADATEKRPRERSTGSVLLSPSDTTSWRFFPIHLQRRKVTLSPNSQKTCRPQEHTNSTFGPSTLARRTRGLETIHNHPCSGAGLGWFPPDLHVSSTVFEIVWPVPG
jgi:hypothetical protein